MKHTVFQALADAAIADEPVVLGLISGVKGSSPQKIGAKALFYQDGRIAGTLGGGCLEAEIQHRALQSLKHGQPTSFELLLDHDFGWDDGLICGGKVMGLILPQAQRVGAQFWSELAQRKTPRCWGVDSSYAIRCESATQETRSTSAPADWLYRERVSPPCALWIAGAGHIAQAVAPLAARVDFDVTVFDDRPALASRDFFPPEIQLRADLWERLLTQSPPAAVPSFALIVTRGHRHDAAVLRSWVRAPFLFLGMIGSHRKARTIFEHFLNEHLATPQELARVACPVGIAIRSQSVPEIAVSILAQFIDRRAELVYGRAVTGPGKVVLLSDPEPPRS